MKRQVYYLLLVFACLYIQTPIKAQVRPTVGKSQHMKFLGLELGGDARQFEKALRNKGFNDNGNLDNNGNDIILNGTVYGWHAEVWINATGGKISEVSIHYFDVDNLAATKKRYAEIKKRVITEYGTGKSKSYEYDYSIKFPYGSVTCGYRDDKISDFEVYIQIHEGL